MSEAIYTATCGALVQQMRLEVLTNNLSNANTVGFKEDRTVFRAYFPGDINGDAQINLPPGESEIVASYIPSNFHVTFEGTQTNFSPGELRHTGNALDLALDGNGFFCVRTPQGTQYTRKGNFVIDQEGVLATQEGFPVLGQGGEIRLDGSNVVVDGEGNISVDGNSVDTIRVVDFPQSNVLKKMGNTLFALADANVTENSATHVTVNQGFIELSNVNTIKIMTEMIEALRGYQSYQKAITTMDGINSRAINDVGKVT